MFLVSYLPQRRGPKQLRVAFSYKMHLPIVLGAPTVLEKPA